jgi:site-specific DNA-adenine methylase
MKNHFFFGYAGNKRNETEQNYNTLDLTNIKTIIEPFCGTSAISFYISTKHPKQFNYILNDSNKLLIDLYKISIDDEALNNLINELNEDYREMDKEKYLNIIKNDTIKAFIFKHKIYKIRPGLFPLKKPNVDFNYLRASPIIQFLKTEKITLLNDDGYNVFKTYENNKESLIIVDPPYLDSCNDFYKLNPTLINIYEYLSLNSIKWFQSKIVCILESNWIIRLLFKDYDFINYDKTYEMSKKKTIHSIIKNF